MPSTRFRVKKPYCSPSGSSVGSLFDPPSPSMICHIPFPRGPRAPSSVGSLFDPPTPPPARPLLARPRAPPRDFSAYHRGISKRPVIFDSGFKPSEKLSYRLEHQPNPSINAIRFPSPMRPSEWLRQNPQPRISRRQQVSSPRSFNSAPVHDWLSDVCPLDSSESDDVFSSCSSDFYPESRSPSAAPSAADSTSRAGSSPSVQTEELELAERAAFATEIAKATEWVEQFRQAYAPHCQVSVSPAETSSTAFSFPTRSSSPGPSSPRDPFIDTGAFSRARQVDQQKAMQAVRDARASASQHCRIVSPQPEETSSDSDNDTRNFCISSDDSFWNCPQATFDTDSDMDDAFVIDPDNYISLESPISDSDDSDVVEDHRAVVTLSFRQVPSMSSSSASSSPSLFKRTMAAASSVWSASTTWLKSWFN